MASTIEIFNSGKVDFSKLTGSDSFFNSIGEITESVNAQNKFISNVDYSEPSNFIKFGNAEEYYKNAINYINSEYPFDGYTSEKLKWINSLNEFEYYLFTQEYPKHSGYLQLNSSQYISGGSPNRDNSSTTAQETYFNGEKYFVNENLSFKDGFTFEGWLNFSDISSKTSILNVNTVVSGVSGLYDETLIESFVSASSLWLSGSSNSASFSYAVPQNEWHHYAISVNNSSASLYVDGIITSKLPSISLYSAGYLTSSYSFLKLGLVNTNQTSSINSTGSYVKVPVFKIGGNNVVGVDEARFWNNERTLEKIGRYWFGKVDGNDLSDTNNSDLIFYYKFNEGWDSQYGAVVLDYSGYRNNGTIINYTSNCRISGSAINSSSLVQDLEAGDVIIAPSVSYSTQLYNYYNTKISSAVDYDELNEHALYKKFPSWILEQEEEQDTKHLKQVIQVVSVYFDDLYNKIGEISKYKHLQFNNDDKKLYPFYDKILTSTGFDVTDLFNNLNIVEKISSRTDKNLFDEDISKIKNNIFQNIYNNLSYILKSKGTEKSLKSFLRSYGINENLVRINLYADKSQYTISDKYADTIVKKKTITVAGGSNIYLSGTALSMPVPVTGNYFTLETSVIFPAYLAAAVPATSSVFGFYTANVGSYAPNSGKLQAYVTVEHDSLGYRFCLRSGSTGDLIGSSSNFVDLYDDTTWNLAIGFKPNVDDVITAGNTYNYLLDFRAINTYKENTTELLIVGTSSATTGSSFYSGDGRYFVGARRDSMTGSLVEESYAKFLYCNFWSMYLSDNELTAHNRDVLNYGVE